MGLIYQIDIGYACAGVIVKDNIVVNAAPIFKWMISKKFNPDIIDWINKKGGAINETR